MGDHHNEGHGSDQHKAPKAPKPAKKAKQKQPPPKLEVDDLGLPVLPKREPKISIDELRKEAVPQAYRDYCAHLLVPLNRCRYDNLFLPTRCQHERHIYEQCMYEDYLYRLEERKREQLRAQRDKQQQHQQN